MYEIFITVHDEDLILKLEKNKIFCNLKKYRYLFLGNRPTDKLEKIKDKVIVAKNLANNIENYSSLLDYTGWWAVAKNNIAKEKFVCFIQYDYYIYKNFEKQLKKAFENNPQAIICPLPGVWNLNNFKNDKYSISLAENFKKIKNIDIMNEKLINEKAKNLENFPFGNSFACSIETLKKYIDWSEPIIDTLSKQKYAGHKIERSVGFFGLMNNYKFIGLDNAVEHIYACDHPQKYEDTASKDLIEDFLDGYFNKLEKQRIRQKFLSLMFSITKEACIDYDKLKINLFGIKLNFKIKHKKTKAGKMIYLDKFDNIIPLGYNCQTAFAMQAILGKIQSSFFNWVYILDIYKLISFLNSCDLSFSEEGGVSFLRKNCMYKDNELDFCYHSSNHNLTLINKDNTLNFENIEKDKQDVISKMTYLKNKFFNIANSNSKNLFIMCFKSDVANNRFPHTIELLSKTIDKISGNKNSKLLIILEDYYAKTLILPKFDNIIYKTIRNFSKDAFAFDIDLKRWKEIYLEVMPYLNKKEIENNIKNYKKQMGLYRNISINLFGIKLRHKL